MTLQAYEFSSLTSMASDVVCDSTMHPSSSAKMTKFSYGLSPITNRYDTFLIDQWGVLHDGHKPYEGAVECLRRLTMGGKQVIIISNSGKRAADNESRLHEIGFPRDSYSHLVTSGEIAWQMLAKGLGPFRNLEGKRCQLLSGNDPSEFAKRLPISITETIEDADFILLAGIDDKKPQQYLSHIIATGVRLGIPLICANPDLTRITSDGLKPGAGAMANCYQAMGGQVSYIGKPHPEIYTYCLSLVPNVPESRVLAVGDSIHHDVAGGMSAGFDTLLTLRGVHVGHFIDKLDPLEINQRIRNIAGPFGPIPNFAVPSFRW